MSGSAGEEMTSGITPLLELAVDDIFADGGLADRVVVATRRRQRRRLAAGGIVAAVALGFAGLGLHAWSGHHRGQNVVSIVASPTMKPTGATVAGPQGLPGPLDIYGREYPVGTVTAAKGGRVDEVLFAAQSRRAPSDSPWLCTAQWVPGSPLTTARVDACTQPSSERSGEVWVDGPEPAPLGVLTNPSYEGKEVLAFRSDVARADLLLTRSFELAATASTDGGHPPIRLRMPVGLLGSGEPGMPVVLGTIDPPPAGYAVVGVEAWNSAGAQLAHDVTGWTCVRSPSRSASSLACPQ